MFTSLPKWQYVTFRVIAYFIIRGILAFGVCAVCGPCAVCDCADDTYVIIPACNSHSRLAELDHIGTWAGYNNLHLNRVKSVELIVSVPRRRRQFNPPPCIPEIKDGTSTAWQTVLIRPVTDVAAEGEHRRVGTIPDSPVWLVSTTWHCTISYKVCLYNAEAEEG